MRDRTTLGAFLLIVLLAGGSGVAIRFSNHELAPLWGATLRFAIATVVLLVALIALRIPLPRGRAAVGSALYGILGFGITFGLAYWGLVDVGAGLAQIILALVPLFTFLLAVAQGLERFRWQTLVGTVIALAGIAVIFGDQVRDAVPLISMLAVVGGAFSMAESNVVIKRFPRAHPVATNAVAMGAATLVLLAATLVTREPRAVPTFEPQSEPQEVLPDAQLLPDRRGDSLRGARHGVVEEGLRAPQARRGLDQLDLLQDVDGLLLPALHLEAQDTAVEPPLQEELVRGLAIGAVSEAWVVDGVDLGMVVEELRERERALALHVEARLERRHPAQGEEGLEGPHYRAQPPPELP